MAEKEHDILMDACKISSSRCVRILLIVAGTVSVALGVIGIFLPLLPTTPFLLLAAACYSRSSRRFYVWLMTNRVFGNYICNYHLGRGIPVKVKAATITLLWATILLSAFFFMESAWIRLLLLIIAAGVTVHILKIKTLREWRK